MRTARDAHRISRRFTIAIPISCYCLLLGWNLLSSLQLTDQIASIAQLATAVVAISALLLSGVRCETRGWTFGVCKLEGRSLIEPDCSGSYYSRAPLCYCRAVTRALALLLTGEREKLIVGLFREARKRMGPIKREIVATALSRLRLLNAFSP